MFVTYTAVQTPSSENPSDLSNVTLTMEALNLNSGQVEWSARPMILSNVWLYWTEVLVGPTFALLVSTSADPPRGALTVLAVNLSGGETLGTWEVPLPQWTAIPPSEEVGLSLGTLVIAYPPYLNNSASTSIEIEGIDALSGQTLWQNVTQLWNDFGWGTGSVMEYGAGSRLVFAMNPGGSEYNGGKIVVVNGQSGAITLQVNVSAPSSVMNGAVAGNAYYFLANSSNELRIDGVNLSTGGETSPIGVSNVADGALISALLYAAGTTLIVASYSPSLSYTAYQADGVESWAMGFPNSPSCTPAPTWPAIGLCATLLSAPMPYGNGSSVLLSSVASGLVQGASYHNVYRLVDLNNGKIEWSSEYTFTYGGFTLFSGPVPTITVEEVIGTEIIYTIQTPNGTTTACGTL